MQERRCNPTWGCPPVIHVEDTLVPLHTCMYSWAYLQGAAEVSKGGHWHIRVSSHAIVVRDGLMQKKSVSRSLHI